MALNKVEFNDDEVPIFEEALVYKRGEYWQMCMWLAKEHKYARFSLKTRNRSTAIDKAKLDWVGVTSFKPSLSQITATINAMIK